MRNVRELRWLFFGVRQFKKPLLSSPSQEKNKLTPSLDKGRVGEEFFHKEFNSCPKSPIVTSASIMRSTVA